MTPKKPHKTKVLHVRMTLESKKELEVLCRKNGITQADALRKGLKLIVARMRAYGGI